MCVWAYSSTWSFRCVVLRRGERTTPPFIFAVPVLPNPSDQPKKGWTQFSSWEFYHRIGHFSFMFLLVSHSLWMLLLFICGSKLSVFSFLLNTWQCCFVFVFRYWCDCCSTNDLASVVLALSCCLKEASRCRFAQSNLAETGIPPRAHLCCRFHSSNYFRLDFFLSLPY